MIMGEGVATHREINLFLCAAYLALKVINPALAFLIQHLLSPIWLIINVFMVFPTSH
jgi:hypothetical protein